MHVSFLVDGKEEYGVRRIILDIAGELGEHDASFIVLSDGQFIEDARKAGLKAHCLGLDRPPPAFRLGLVQKLLSLYRLERYNRRIRETLAVTMKEVDPDLIVVNYLPHINVVPKGKGGRAWLIHNDISNNYPLDLNRRVIRRRLRRNDVQPVANSRYIANRLAMPGLDVPHVHLGVDLNRFRPDRPDFVTRRQLGIPEDATVFAIFARLVPEKGQRLFLETLASAEFRVHKPHLLLAGDLPIDQSSSQGSYVESLRRLAREAGLEGHLHLLGNIAEPELYYGAVDIAVNARLDAEPFGLSIIEALAAGCPVLAHALGGPAEILKDGRTGWLFQAATPESCKAALARSLADRSRWSQMRHAARDDAAARFGLPAAARNFVRTAMTRGSA